MERKHIISGNMEAILLGEMLHIILPLDILILLKRCDNYPRKNCWFVLETKWHHRILETSTLCYKSGFVSVFFHDPYLVIAQKSICEWIDLLSSHFFQYFVCKWCWEQLMNTCIIQLPEVKTDPYFTHLFVLNNHQTDPFRFFKIFDNASIQHFV